MYTEDIITVSEKDIHDGMTQDEMRALVDPEYPTQGYDTQHFEIVRNNGKVRIKFKRLCCCD